jgi:hypothetical protein
MARGSDSTAAECVRPVRKASQSAKGARGHAAAAMARAGPRNAAHASGRKPLAARIARLVGPPPPKKPRAATRLGNHRPRIPTGIAPKTQKALKAASARKPRNAANASNVSEGLEAIVAARHNVTARGAKSRTENRLPPARLVETWIWGQFTGPTSLMPAQHPNKHKFLTAPHRLLNCCLPENNNILLRSRVVTLNP